MFEKDNVRITDDVSRLSSQHACRSDCTLSLWALNQLYSLLDGRPCNPQPARVTLTVFALSNNIPCELFVSPAHTWGNFLVGVPRCRCASRAASLVESLSFCSDASNSSSVVVHREGLV